MLYDYNFKEEFFKILNYMVKTQEAYRKIDEIFDVLNKDCYAFEIFESGFLIEKALDFLVILADLDKDWVEDSDWITWWVMENECGKGQLSCFTNDNREFFINTVQELWDFGHGKY